MITLSFFWKQNLLALVCPHPTAVGVSTDGRLIDASLIVWMYVVRVTDSRSLTKPISFSKVDGSKSGWGTTCDVATVTRVGSSPSKLLEPSCIFNDTALKNIDF